MPDDQNRPNDLLASPQLSPLKLAQYIKSRGGEASRWLRAGTVFPSGFPPPHP